MKTSRFRELFPTILAVMLVLSFAAMMLEILIDSARGVPIDPVGVPALGALCGTLTAALAGFWLADSRALPPRPPDDEDRPPGQRPRLEETGDEDSDEFNRRHGYFETRGLGSWTPC